MILISEADRHIISEVFPSPGNIHQSLSCGLLFQLYTEVLIIHNTFLIILFSIIKKCSVTLFLTGVHCKSSFRDVGVYNCHLVILKMIET